MRFSCNHYIPIHSHELKNNKTIQDLIHSHLMFYDYFELLDETKTYPVDEFDFEFIPGKKRRYIFNGIIFSFEDKEYSYVAAKERLTREEKKILSESCQCVKHQMSFFNIRKYFLCPCCVGCLESENPSPKVIWLTRKKLSSKKTNWSKEGKVRF